MHRLLIASWSLVAESAGMVAAERLRRLHDRPAERVEELIRRGQADGLFRTDLPLPWLTSAVHMLIHGVSGRP